MKVLDNLSTGKLCNLEKVKEKIYFKEGDIRDFKTVKNVCEGCDIIFHQAAIVSVPKTIKQPLLAAAVNDLGTLNVLEAARVTNVKRVVIASSCAVYGDNVAVPKQEKMLVMPQSPYAVQKLSGEFHARLYHDLYGVETVSLRYFNVYGPRQDPSSPYSGVISIFMDKAAAKKPPVIYGNGNQYRDFIFVKDVVRFNLLAADADEANGEIFNVGTGRFIRINSLWEMITKLSGQNIKPEYEPPRSGDIIESVADIDRARKTLGFKPEYSFEKGLEETFEYYLTTNEHK